MVFVNIAIACMYLVIAYVLFIIARYIRITLDRDIKYDVFEEIMLNKYAEKKGIDLDKEIAKKELFKQTKTKKCIRERLKEEIYEDLFGKDKDAK